MSYHYRFLYHIVSPYDPPSLTLQRNHAGVLGCLTFRSPQYHSVEKPCGCSRLSHLPIPPVSLCRETMRMFQVVSPSDPPSLTLQRNHADVLGCLTFRSPQSHSVEKPCGCSRLSHLPIPPVSLCRETMRMFQVVSPSDPPSLTLQRNHADVLGCLTFRSPQYHSVEKPCGCSRLSHLPIPPVSLCRETMGMFQVVSPSDPPSLTLQRNHADVLGCFTFRSPQSHSVEKPCGCSRLSHLPIPPVLTLQRNHADVLGCLTFRSPQYHSVEKPCGCSRLSHFPIPPVPLCRETMRMFQVVSPSDPPSTTLQRNHADVLGCLTFRSPQYSLCRETMRMFQVVSPSDPPSITLQRNHADVLGCLTFRSPQYHSVEKPCGCSRLSHLPIPPVSLCRETMRMFQVVSPSDPPSTTLQRNHADVLGCLTFRSPQYHSVEKPCGCSRLSHLPIPPVLTLQRNHADVLGCLTFRSPQYHSVEKPCGCSRLSHLPIPPVSLCRETMRMFQVVSPSDPPSLTLQRNHADVLGCLTFRSPQYHSVEKPCGCSRLSHLPIPPVSLCRETMRMFQVVSPSDPPSITLQRNHADVLGCLTFRSPQYHSVEKPCGCSRLFHLPIPPVSLCRETMRMFQVVSPSDPPSITLQRNHADVLGCLTFRSPQYHSVEKPCGCSRLSHLPIPPVSLCRETMRMFQVVSPSDPPSITLQRNHADVLGCFTFRSPQSHSVEKPCGCSRLSHLPIPPVSLCRETMRMFQVVSPSDPPSTTLQRNHADVLGCLTFRSPQSHSVEKPCGCSRLFHLPIPPVPLCRETMRMFQVVSPSDPPSLTLQRNHADVLGCLTFRSPQYHSVEKPCGCSKRAWLYLASH